MSWTEERISNLKTLWHQGKSASEIAASLGEVTRNAVIGKAHRLGLDGRPSPIKGPVRPRVRKVPKTATILSMSERMCKWPVGDPRQPDFHFCGCAAAPSLPYCAEHAAIAYQPMRHRDDNKHAARA